MDAEREQAARLSVVADPEALRLVGKLVLIDRGYVQVDQIDGYRVLIGGVLVCEGENVLSSDVIAAATAEQWDVELVLRPVAKRRGLDVQRGTLERLLAYGLNDPSYWDEHYDPQTQRWNALNDDACENDTPEY